VKDGITCEKLSVNLTCDSDSHVNHRVLLHAANLQHETDGFTCCGFFRPKNPTASAGIERPLTEMSTRNISWGVKVAGA
jgi:hypothetical protein